jgi:hypothetical protein
MAAAGSRPGRYTLGLVGLRWALLDPRIFKSASCTSNWASSAILAFADIHRYSVKFGDIRPFRKKIFKHETQNTRKSRELEFQKRPMKTQKLNQIKPPHPRND